MNCSETLMPVEGESIVVFALSGPDNLPDLSTAKAFYLNRSMMLNINPGVWHWIPFPLKDKADFMVILSKKAFDGKDIEVIDLKETLKISLKN
ncbi:MAG: ureidoglycolate lyase [Candidatus Humimicrobiaceae bacterium]